MIVSRMRRGEKEERRERKKRRKCRERIGVTEAEVELGLFRETGRCSAASAVCGCGS